MRKIFIAIAVCACIVGAATQCVNAQRTRVKASTNYVTRDIPNLGHFDAIRAQGIVDIDYRQSTDGSTSVKVYGSDNVLPYLEVVNEGGTLVARTINNLSITGESKLKVTVSGPALKKAKCSGASDINLIGSINTGDLTLEASGAGDIQFNTITCGNLKVECSGSSDLEGESISCKTFDLRLSGASDADIDHIAAASIKISASGASDVEIAGTATDVNMSVSGAGDIDASELRAETVNAAASGASHISCYATKRLEASASGASSVVYGGNPATVNLPAKQKGVRPR